MLTFESSDIIEKGAIIKVIGVGGGGCNAVSHMVDSGVRGVDMIAVNTDVKALNKCLAETKVQIGEKLTRGRGAGADPQKGQLAAEESIDEVTDLIDGCDMVFITAGMGGGTGTGAAPIIARAAKSMGILTIGVVTKPFDFEGKQRASRAELGIDYLKRYVDSLVVIPNQRLVDNIDKKISFIDAFKMADDVLRQAIQGISDIISDDAMINVDFEDVKTTMSDKGIAHIGVGHGTGDNKLKDAVKQATESPLLETKIDGARSILLYYVGGYDVGMQEVSDVSDDIKNIASEDCNIIFGYNADPDIEDEIYVTIVATGFESEEDEEDGEDHLERVPAGMAAKKNPEPERKSAPQQTKQQREPAKTTIAADGLTQKEVSLTDLMKDADADDKDKGFTVPPFLKSGRR